jgi:hypothetical protein
LLEDDAVNARIQSFTSSLKDADKKIHIVGDYKALHDCLHRLQFKVFDNFLSAAQNFNKPIATVQLKMCKSDLSREIGKLKKIFEPQRLPLNDFPWLGDIETVSKTLDVVLSEQKLSSLEEIILVLTDVMRVQPSVVNSLLINAVRQLNLSSLQITLKEIYNELQTLGADEDQLFFFKKGVDDLVRLDNELNKQIREHQQWQRIDNDLQQTKNAMSRTDEELKKSWTILSDRIGLICKETTSEDWSERLLDLNKEINEAIRTDDKMIFITLFPEYMAEARTRFYEVDLNLKILCEQLRPVGDTVHAVLKALE